MMDSTPNISNMLEEAIGSLGNLAKTATATVVVGNSSGVDLQKEIDDRVLGLLVKDSLTVEEIQLLSALLQGK